MNFTHVLAHRTFDESGEHTSYTLFETKNAALQGMLKEVQDTPFEYEEEPALDLVMDNESFWRCTWERRGHYEAWYLLEVDQNNQFEDHIDISRRFPQVNT